MWDFLKSIFIGSPTSVESSETMLSTYGELEATIKSLTDMELTWKVDDFFGLPKGERTVSDVFRIPGGLGFIIMRAHGTSIDRDLVSFLVTFTGSSFTAIAGQVDLQMALKTAEGKLYTKRLTQGDQEEESTTEQQSYSFYRHFKRSEIVDKKELLVPQGNLTVYVAVKSRSDAAERTSSMNQESEASTSVLSESVDGDLEQALTGLSVGGKDRSVTISTGGKTFKTCMSILCLRAPAFASEIQKRLKDAQTSTVDIGDLCSLSAFRPFLEFVNTGDVQHLTKETAFELYVTADRFKMEELKELCAKRTKESEPKFMILNA